MEILLIRHGMTEGNRFQRYIGITDEPLCQEGRLMLHRTEGSDPDFLFVSPLLRCRQTAQILFPDTDQIVIEELAEMNFGIFENRSWQEGLSESPEYQKWLDSGCEDPIPRGESKKDFTERCVRGFEKALANLEESKCHRAAFVVHGGTIMSVLSEFAEPSRPYYEWHTGNGHGYAGTWKDGRLVDLREI